MDADTHTDRSRQLTGVWIEPRHNTRVDITRHGDQWIATSALDRRGAVRPYAATFDSADGLRAGIGRLEGQGYVRQPEMSPRSAPLSSVAEDVKQAWSPGNTIGALVLFAVIVVIGIVILS